MKTKINHLETKMTKNFFRSHYFLVVKKNVQNIFSSKALFKHFFKIDNITMDIGSESKLGKILGSRSKFSAFGSTTLVRTLWVTFIRV